MKPSLFLTDDGSHSLRDARFGASYHSTYGAVKESRHVFIQAGLEDLLATHATIPILEMGFGTGLNALLVRQLADLNPSIDFHYTTYEQYPVSPRQVRKLNFPEVLACPPAWLYELHDADWETVHHLTPNFTLLKHRQDFLAGPQDAAQVIFYDAFAPEQQPELWTVAAMEHCYRLLAPGGRLVTYCAKGQFKRNLRAVGFRVEGLPGPVGKREMTRALI
ncbi:tRNA (5-methylaminomethyl-2-thiouridine)(34)-methyltransferase MnmD [Neolewinella sp.]|uniref:tRNA (5-methylaminomethyl-2-thiouridine)(34)-methyltransferase MnmD n=1 Tax=Neolewinella sp. TaxID=2993543 RepID=UPI003B5159FE